MEKSTNLRQRKDAARPCDKLFDLIAMYFEGRSVPDRISVKQLWSDFSSWYSDTLTLTGPHAVLNVSSDDVTQHDFDQIIMGRCSSRPNLGIAIRCTLRINGKSIPAYEFKPGWEEKIQSARNQTTAPSSVSCDRDGFGLLFSDSAETLHRYEPVEPRNPNHFDKSYLGTPGGGASPRGAYHRHTGQAVYSDYAAGAYWEQPTAADVLCAPSPSTRHADPQLAATGRREAAGRDVGDGLWGVWEESAACGGGEDADESTHRHSGQGEHPFAHIRPDGEGGGGGWDGGYDQHKRPRLHAPDGGGAQGAAPWGRAEAGLREEDWTKLAGRGFAALS